MKEIPRRAVLKASAMVAAVPFLLEAVSRLNTVGQQYERDRLPKPEIHFIPPHSKLIGIAPDLSSSHDASVMIENLGIQPAVINYFLGGVEKSTDMIQKRIEWCLSQGIIPMLSWGPNRSVFAQEEKDYLHVLAQTFRRVNGPIIFRPWYEMNGIGWFPYNEPHISAKTWKQYWKETYEIIKDTSTNTVVLFSPNQTKPGTNSIEKYWPGEDYIDLTGLDGYNKYTPKLFQVGQHLLSADVNAQQLFGPDIYTLQALGPHLPPPVISELNAYRPDRADWLISSLGYLYSTGIRLICFFNWNKRGGGFGETDWSFDGLTMKKLRRHFFEKDWYIHDHDLGSAQAKKNGAFLLKKD